MTTSLGLVQEKCARAAAAERVSIVIPVHNQVEYTRSCLESLSCDLVAGAEVIVVDNASTDDTPTFLSRVTGVATIRNEQNRGCAPGWNQGVQAASREWIVVLNNDVVVARGWLEAMIAFAESKKLDVVTPGIREGILNYSFADYAADYVSRMQGRERLGVANGICFMVHRRVFDAIGGFDEGFRVGGFEDSDFFLRCKKAGFRLGTTGSAFLHHFGSITQIALRKNGAERGYEAENRIYFRKKWNLTRPKRLYERFLRKWRTRIWAFSEQFSAGHSLHEKWLRGRLRYY